MKNYTFVEFFLHLSYHSNPMNSLFYLDIDQEMEKSIWVFAFVFPSEWQNFEAIQWNISSSINIFFLKSDYV